MFSHVGNRLRLRRGRGLEKEKTNLTLAYLVRDKV
jgi:hypothetical protein